MGYDCSHFSERGLSLLHLGIWNSLMTRSSERYTLPKKKHKPVQISPVQTSNSASCLSRSTLSLHQDSSKQCLLHICQPRGQILYGGVVTQAVLGRRDLCSSSADSSRCLIPRYPSGLPSPFLQLSSVSQYQRFQVAYQSLRLQFQFHQIH